MEVAIAALLALLLGCSGPADAPEPPPAARPLAPSAGHPPPIPPTEHWVHQDAEMRNKERRKAYFRERHRAPPGVDVAAVERANGLAAVARRNAMAGRRSADPYGARWVERGSENQAGRMMMAVRSADGQSLYAGSSLGGVWRGSLQGEDWEPLGDGLYGGARWLALFPPDAEGGPEVMLAASAGGLVHRSADDGATWTEPAGVAGLWTVRRLVVLGDGSEVALMVVGERTGRYQVLRSPDRGRSWVSVRDLGGYAGDLWVGRDGGSAIWLVDDHRLFRSDDGGMSWVEQGALPVRGGRAELAGSEAGGPRLWVAADEAELYRSDDGGQSWVLVRALEDYWGVIAASIVDPDTVAWGGVELHRSHDGGQTFSVVNAWSEYYLDPLTKLHADIMGLDAWPDPDGGETWFIGTDGGLFTSPDGLDTVENLSLRGLRVSQYYATLTDRSDPGRVAAGSQDQGYQLTTGIAQSGERWDFDQVLSGDYGHLTSTDGTHAYLYSVYPGFVLAQIGAEDPEYRYIGPPPDPLYAWLPPIVAHPERRKQFFFPASRIWRYRWEEERSTWSYERWGELALEDGDYLTGLAFSPVDPQRAWAVSSTGRLFYSTDQGLGWTEATVEGPSSHWLYGTAILPDREDPDLVYVAGSGYGGPSVWRSRTGGTVWQPFDDGLPPTLVSALCQAPDGSGTLFAGTETGAWRRDRGADQEWVPISGIDAPITTYWSCEALQHENTIRWGTYGRGIWDYQLDPEGTGCFPPVDRDGDGVACDLDCDDADPEVYPGRWDPPCDGIDHDCDPSGESEEECATLSGGCGCSASTRPAGVLGLLLLLPLVARRRRLWAGRCDGGSPRPAPSPPPGPPRGPTG